jgi:hypothetical protein
LKGKKKERNNNKGIKLAKERERWGKEREKA